MLFLYAFFEIDGIYKSFLIASIGLQEERSISAYPKTFNWRFILYTPNWFILLETNLTNWKFYREKKEEKKVLSLTFL